VEKTVVRQAVPLAAHGGPQWSRYPLAACGRPHIRAGECLKEAVTLWEARAGAGSWKDLWPHGKSSPRQSRFAGRACDPVGDPRWSSQLLKDCIPRCSHFCMEKIATGRS